MINSSIIFVFKCIRAIEYARTITEKEREREGGREESMKCHILYYKYLNVTFISNGLSFGT